MSSDSRSALSEPSEIILKLAAPLLGLMCAVARRGMGCVKEKALAEEAKRRTGRTDFILTILVFAY